MHSFPIAKQSVIEFDSFSWLFHSLRSIIKSIQPQSESIMLKKTTALFVALLSCSAYAENTCQKLGGKIEKMQINFSTSQGLLPGFTKKFCSFEIDNGYACLGLQSMNSKKTNIAASYVLNLPPIDENSPLWNGTDNNPSHNVCKNLGGSYAQMVSNGSFQSELGDSDICVFGDGSMISAWTLIYIANGREGYHLIKDHIPSKALPLN